MNNEKYPALSLISALYKIFGWITLLVGVVCFAWAIFGANAFAFVFALSALFAALLSFAFAEAIIVLVDIELNTRSKYSSSQMHHETDSSQTHDETDTRQVGKQAETTIELADKDLLKAVRDGDSATASQLLKKGISAVAVDDTNKTLLKIANENRDSMMIQLLKAYGAK